MRVLLEALWRTNLGYRFYLRRHYGARGRRPSRTPHASWHNAVLKTVAEWKAAVEQTRLLGLPLHGDPPKNWDNLAALDCILRQTSPSARVLDAGGELYSVILPSLWLYGYRDLTCINLTISEPFMRGSIRYEHGNIVRTRFGPDTFDVLTCLSVIEHGVDLEGFFAEAARILRTDGLLIISTDYYADPINTRGQVAYGVPIHIFSRGDILRAIELAEAYGLRPTGRLDLDVGERAVRWARFNLEYTFVVFTLRKKSSDN